MRARLMFFRAKHGDLASLAEAIHRVAPEGGGFAIMRHSIRKRIWKLSVEGAMKAPLTPAGRDLARQFGRSLRTPALTMASSPVDRCLETARCIREGHGGPSPEPGPTPWDTLGAPFFLDPQRAILLYRKRDKWGVLERWARGEYADLLVPFHRGIADLLSSLIQRSETMGREGFPIFLTHDVTLAALVYAFHPAARSGLPWPAYLEGAVIQKRGDRIFFHYRGLTASRSLGEMTPRAPAIPEGPR